MLEVCVGPQTTLIGTLSEDTVAGDELVTLDDVTQVLQVGTLVFSPGQATEETVEFCFTERSTNRLFLTSALANVHTAVDPGSGRLEADTSSGAATLTLVESNLLPRTGYPYSIIVDRGLSTEETLVVTDNDVATNVLTLDSPTTQDHEGPKAQFYRTELPGAVAVGIDF